MITFRNKGLVDLRAITTFGVNSKDTKTAIGQFGTGFKYAVAVVLRLGGTVVVMRGLERFEFTKRIEQIRNDEFGMVYMNEQQLGFTTHLGHHWEPWQAFRELYCNMLDEAGPEALDAALTPKAGYTDVIIELPAFDEVWAQRHTVVLPAHFKPLYKDERIQIFNEPSNYLFYRGVRVATLDKPARHTFNVLEHLELTEDRTLQYQSTAQHVVATRVMKLESKALIKQLLFTGRGTFEHELQYSQWMDSSKSFLDVIHKGRASLDINFNALAYFRVKNPEVALPKRVTNVQRQERRDLKNAIALCAVLGYDVSGYPVVITDDLPEEVLGQVFPKHSDKIFLARRVFTQGVNMVTGTLLEEYIHLKYGLEDNTRRLQNHLLDALVRAAERLQAKEVAEKV